MCAYSYYTNRFTEEATKEWSFEIEEMNALEGVSIHGEATITEGRNGNDRTIEDIDAEIFIQFGADRRLEIWDDFKKYLAPNFYKAIEAIWSQSGSMTYNGGIECFSAAGQKALRSQLNNMIPDDLFEPEVYED